MSESYALYKIKSPCVNGGYSDYLRFKEYLQTSSYSLTPFVKSNFSLMGMKQLESRVIGV